MVIPTAPDTPAPEAKNGVIDGYLYINDVKQRCYQLVEYDGNFYFINDGHKVVMNGYAHVSAAQAAGKTFPDGTPITAGKYYFDAEGKMVIPTAPETPDTPDEPDPTVKNGVINGYLYINDVIQTSYQLVEYDGNFYFVNDGRKVAMDKNIYLSAAQVAGKTFPNGSPITAGKYYFDAEGKMVFN